MTGVSFTRNNGSGIGLPTREELFVNGERVPLVAAKVQDSFAGRMPISSDGSDNRSLFFWYWPSSAKHGSTDLTIWLNGGPGCSSLIGLLTENGPFTFRPGTPAPSVNRYAWSTVSDVLYVDQPIGTGFSSGTPTTTTESDVANEFYEFLKNFYTVFPEILQKRLFIAGESYAGMYIPYIAHRIVTAKAKERAAFPINLQSVLIGDGTLASLALTQAAPLADYVIARQMALGLNQSVVRSIQAVATKCDWRTLMADVVYPPKGPISFDEATVPDVCFDIWDQAVDAAFDANPCFNLYRITDKCPTPDDPISAYFSRADVQEILHVPAFGPWKSCGAQVFVNGSDTSAFSYLLLPMLTELLPRGMALWHGLDDFLYLANGTRLVIQNLTWGGHQGFQRPITQEIILDGHSLGLQHSERGLTYYEVANTGHMIPADQPKLALEAFKTLLGRGSLIHTNRV
ncbi:alpha/beta-hydrolase [Auricularia subglabra TFB-10046 SS5]|nr:alpha/beta-hydrolase [Auricularia subglabra TFB-10046 SS5]